MILAKKNLTNEFFLHFPWLIAILQCFEIRNKNNRSIYLLKRYDNLKVPLNSFNLTYHANTCLFDQVTLLLVGAGRTERSKHKASTVRDNQIYALRQRHITSNGNDSKRSSRAYSRGHDFISMSNKQLHVSSNKPKRRMLEQTKSPKRKKKQKTIGHHARLGENDFSFPWRF